MTLWTQFLKSTTGWYKPTEVKYLEPSELPIIETENYRNVNRYVPGYRWFVDSTTRKSPRNGYERYLQQFRNPRERKKMNPLGLIIRGQLYSKLHKSKGRPQRYVDQVIYHSDYEIRPNPEHIFHTLRTKAASCKYPEHAEMKEYTKTFKKNRQRTVNLNTIKFLSLAVFLVLFNPANDSVMDWIKGTYRKLMYMRTGNDYYLGGTKHLATEENVAAALKEREVIVKGLIANSESREQIKQENDLLQRLGKDR